MNSAATLSADDRVPSGTGAGRSKPAGGGVLRRAVWGFKREFVWVGIFSFFVNLLLLAPALYMMQVFDRVMQSQNEFTLIALTLITAGLLAVMGFAEWLRARLLVRSGLRFDAFLAARSFDASLQTQLSQATGNPVQPFTDLMTLRQFLTGNGVFAVFDTPWALIYLAVLYLMHPVLGAVGAGFFVFLALLAWVSHRLTAPQHERSGAAAAASEAYLNGKLRHAETVHAMGMQAHLRARWLGLHLRHLGSNERAQRMARRVVASTKFIQLAQQSIVLAVGAWLVINDDLSAGAMIASNALMTFALRPIGTLVGTWKQFVDARLAYGRLSALLDAQREAVVEPVPAKVHGQITLRSLVATAPQRPTPILKGLAAEFRAGEVVAIIGPSGAGKSTLARCLTGSWPQTEGEVLLDGRPLQAWSRDALGPHVGYLPQEVEFLDGTMAENIARFHDVDSAKVIQAAQRTGIHEMILHLPLGYDTPLGQVGGQLSGGQWQRIGLARAIYGMPALVVLDEPNANLDEAGIAALGKTIVELRALGTTVFMVLHQPELLSLADRVLALDDGVITRLAPAQQARTTAP